MSLEPRRERAFTVVGQQVQRVARHDMNRSFGRPQVDRPIDLRWPGLRRDDDTGDRAHAFARLRDERRP
jgi:hypothetical protein